jgi:hypothetical protein
VTQLLTAKKRAKKKLRIALTKQARDDREAKEGKKGRRNRPKFSVMDQLHDPQAFAERLLMLMRKWATRLSFEHKLLMMELMSRCVKSPFFGCNTYIRRIALTTTSRVTATLAYSENPFSRSIGRCNLYTFRPPYLMRLRPSTYRKI